MSVVCWKFLFCHLQCYIHVITNSNSNIFSYDKPTLHQNFPLHQCEYQQTLDSFYMFLLQSFDLFLTILFLSEKANEQQPKQQEAEKNQFNSLLNITDLFSEVNKVVVVAG